MVGALPPSARRSRLWKRILKWTMISLAGLIVLLAAAGFTYNAIEEHADAQRFPQVGKSVRLGGEFGNLTLNLNCTGSGSLTVILDAGLGIPAQGWKSVQPEVAKFTRVCSYDRAGLGWSSAGPMPRTSSEIARELHALLVAAGEKPPYILVGHSFGGYNVRVYNGVFPSEVAGMVLVDASHEDQDSIMSPAWRQFMKQQESSARWQERLAPIYVYFGLGRLLDDTAELTFLSEKDRREALYLELQTKSYTAQLSELEFFSKSADDVRAAGTLGDKPLIVLTAGGTMGSPPGVPQKDSDDLQKAWINDLQVREAHLSTRGKQIIIRDSDHMIPFERPDSVVSAIHEVWNAVNEATGHGSR